LRKFIAATLFLFLLINCSAYPGQTATLAPLPVSTARLNATPTFQLTLTAPAATVTPLSASTPTLDGESATDWDGIPIMPGAITGEGDEEGYVFTVRASSQQVQDYYQLELAARGWQSLSEENEGSARVLVFVDNASTLLTVRILTRGEEALVLLTR
jgi:hypothetical protein